MAINIGDKVRFLSDVGGGIVRGFQKGNTLTIISGIVVSLISVYKVYWEFNGSFLDTQLYVFLMLLGIGVFFTSRGNS